MEQQEIERIARLALKELGVPSPDLSIEPDGRPGYWRIRIGGPTHGPSTLNIRYGRGSSAQWVRDQIFEQFTR